MTREKFLDRLREYRETVMSVKGLIVIAIALATAIISCGIYGECGK